MPVVLVTAKSGMCCLYSVDFSFSWDDCDTMVLWLGKQASTSVYTHFNFKPYLQLSVAVIALGNPANRERKISVLPAGGIAAKEGVSTFGGMEWWNGIYIVEWTTRMVECFIGHT